MKKNLLLIYVFFLSINAFATLGVMVSKSSYVGGYGISCSGGSDGWAEATVGGGVPPYTVVWNNAATTLRINSLAAGTYYVLVTDSLGATDSASVTLTEPSKFSIELHVTNVSCHGKTDGSVTVDVSGGTASYSYEWNHNSGETGAAIDSLGSGRDSVVVTDANGCIKSDGIKVDGPDAITLSLYSPVHSNGFNLSSGHNDGAIELTVEGGTVKDEPPYYTFQWSNGPFTQNISKLALGQYAVEVTDKNGCVKVDSIFLTSEDSLSPDAVPFNTRGNRLNDSEDWIGSRDSSSLVIKTHNIERLRIDANGNVGIGVDTPDVKLMVNGETRLVGNIHTDALAFTADSTEFPADTTGTEYYRMVMVDSHGNLSSHPLSPGGGAYPAPHLGPLCNIDHATNSAMGAWNYGTATIWTDCPGIWVGIGTATPAYTLDVKGSIRACEIITDLDNCPDFVFEPGYPLPTFEEYASKVDSAKHFPHVLSARELQSPKGANLGELQKGTLQTLEEMFLFMKEMKLEINDSKAENGVMKKEIKSLKEENIELKKEWEKVKAERK